MLFYIIMIVIIEDALALVPESLQTSHRDGDNNDFFSLFQALPMEKVQNN